MNVLVKKRFRLRHVYTMLLALLCYVQTTAQYHIPVKKVSTRENISFNEILDVKQDQNGYIWLGTDKGLYKFNGNSFEIFTANREDSTQLQHQYINKLHIDKNNTLWVGTFYGLHKYLPQNNSFKHYQPQPDDKNWLKGKFINDIAEDKNGNLWLATYRGLTLFNAGDESFKTFDNTNSNLPTRDISCLQYLNDGRLLLGTKGFGVWILEDGVFSEFEQKFTLHDLIWDIYLDKDTILWVSTETSGVLQISPNAKPVYHLNGASIKHIEQTNQNENIVFGGKIWLRNVNKLQNLQLISNNSIIDAPWLLHLQAKNNIHWIFSQENIFIENKHQAFQNFPSDKLPSNKYQLKTITALSTLNDSAFTFKTQENGTFIFNQQNQDISPLYKTNYIWEYKNKICKWKENYFFITQDGFWRYNSTDSSTQLLKEGDFRFYYIDIHGWINVIPQTNKFSQLQKYHPDKDEWKTETMKSKDNLVLPLLGIVGCKTTHDSCQWLFSVESETSISGLFRKTKSDTQFEYFAKANTLNANVFINDICLLPNGKYMLATENGLAMLDPQKKQIETYLQSQLNSLNIKSLLLTNSLLWISTDNGLYSLNTEKQNLQAFDKNDGLNDIIFYPRSSHQSSTGYLFFGHHKGFSYFHPDSIYATVQCFPVNISRIDYQANHKKQSYFPITHNQVIFPAGANNFTFQLSSAGIPNASYGYYKYQIPELSNAWKNVENNTIEISHLPKGKTLKLIVQHLSNTDQLLSKTYIKLHINSKYSLLKVILGVTTLLLILIFGIVNKYKKKRVKSIASPSQHTTDNFIRNLNAIIEKNLSNGEFASADIEKEMGLSRSKLFRTLKGKTKMSVTAYIRHYRLEKAHELLLTKKHTVSEIIYIVGFNSRSYFYRCFKEKYGKNPTELLD